MTKRRRNFNAPVRHRPHRGPQRQQEYEQRFLLPKELAVSIAYIFHGVLSMQEAKELRLPMPIPILVQKERT